MMTGGCCCCCCFGLGAGRCWPTPGEEETEELVDEEEGGEDADAPAAAPLCMRWESLWILNGVVAAAAACWRCPPAPKPGCRGDVGLIDGSEVAVR